MKNRQHCLNEEFGEIGKARVSAWATADTRYVTVSVGTGGAALSPEEARQLSALILRAARKAEKWPCHAEPTDE